MKLRNFFLSALCIASTFSVAVSAQCGISAEEALKTGVITVTGSLNAKGSVLAYEILPEDADRNAIDDTAATEAQYLLGSVKSLDDGTFGFEVILSDKASGGRYVVYVASETEEVSASVSHINRTELNTLSGDLNKAANKDDTFAILEKSYKKAGLSDSEFEAYGERLSKNLTGKSYDTDTLLYDVKALLAIYRVCDGENVDEVIEDSEEIFAINYEEDFKDLSSDIKTEFTALVKSEINASKDYTGLVTDCLIDAGIKKAANYSGLRSVCEKYRDEIGLDFSDYDDLSEYDKGQTFSELFALKPQNAEDVKKNFADCIPKEDKKPSGGGSGGGGGGSSGGIFAGGSKIEKTEETEKTKEIFNDISSHWSKEYVERLYEKSVISGYADGGFHPDSTVTRAEFAQLLKKAFLITATEVREFTDVNANDWFYPAVSECAGAGVIFGSDGMFRPNDKITREDAAVMIERVIKSGAGTDITFADGEEIADYAKMAVSALSSIGVISGDEKGCFNPKMSTTRAQAAVMICRALEIK